jgi:hypothetical protein
VFIKYFDVTMSKPDRAAVAKRWGFACACRRCKMESIGEDKALAAGEKASAAATVAREAAANDPKNKKHGGDMHGDKRGNVQVRESS